MKKKEVKEPKFYGKFVMKGVSYLVVGETKDEVCIIQTFPFADSIPERQLKIWCKKSKGKFSPFLLKK